MYDFTTLRPRRDMGAEKWLGLERSGCADPNLAPLSVADMEFRTAPEITAALKGLDLETLSLEEIVRQALKNMIH